MDARRAAHDGTELSPPEARSGVAEVGAATEHNGEEPFRQRLVEVEAAPNPVHLRLRKRIAQRLQHRVLVHIREAIAAGRAQQPGLGLLEDDMQQLRLSGRGHLNAGGDERRATPAQPPHSAVVSTAFDATCVGSFSSHCCVHAFCKPNVYGWQLLSDARHQQLVLSRDSRVTPHISRASTAHDEEHALPLSAVEYLRLRAAGAGAAEGPPDVGDGGLDLRLQLRQHDWWLRFVQAPVQRSGVGCRQREQRLLEQLDVPACTDSVRSIP